MQPNNAPPQTSWSYQNETPDTNHQNMPNADDHHVTHEPIAWTGSEFLAQHKNGGWYAGLFGALAVVCAIIYFFSRDFLSVGFVAVMGILFAIIASRKPRQLQYLIDENGIHAGQRSYSFSDFKSFSLQRDGAIGYVNLMPLKRLHTELSVYFPPEEEQRIFEALALHIPHEQRSETVADKFSKRIRF